MTQAITQERATAKRRNGAAHDGVSGYALAAHLGVSRQYVEVLVTQGVFDRRADGKFDLDAARLRYIKHLRSDARRSPRIEVASAHVAAKTEMLQLKLAQQRRELVLQSDVDAMLDNLIGILLTGLSGLPARISRDPVTRRNVELACRQIRTELATVCGQLGGQGR